MADEETASGLPVLSAFDKLKLSTNNNYIMNRNNTCSNILVNNNLSNPSQIDKNSPPHSVFKVTAAPEASSSAAGAIVAATESSKCEKSISLPLPQYECNNKTIVMFGGSEMNTTTFAGSSACERSLTSSGVASFSALTPAQCDKTMQILCGASDNNGAIPPLTSSLSSSSSPSSLSLAPSSLASIAMVMPNAGNFDILSSPSSLSSPTNLTVQNKVKKFDSNEVSIKMLNKSVKCKTAVSAASTTASMMQLKPKSAPIICAPPPMVLANQSNKFGNNSASNKKSNPKSKNQNFGFPMLPGRLSSTAAAATKQHSLNMDNNKKRQSSGCEKNEQDTTTTDDRNKKKRCSDRYDSSESSDSGVATSLSCTDSSTASSDASDPGSPYSPILLGDDLHHKSNMPPQTILATTNGNATKSPTTGAATPVQNVLKGGKQQQKHQNQSQNKAVTPQQQTKQGKAQISSPLHKVSQHLWPWTSLGGVGGGGNFSEMASSPKTNVSTLNNKNNKRHSQGSTTPTDGGAKKTRTTNSNIMDSVIVSGTAVQPPQISPNNKRLKVAALEESQTKITGYFKSQMKAQIHQSGLKKDTIAHLLPSSSMSTSSPSVTVTAVVSSSSSPMSSNSIVSTSTSTSSSLNKYFSLLSSQLREDQERISNPPTTLPSLPPALKKIERSKPTKIAQVAPNLRKTTAAPPQSAQVIEKSPKKHVAIAPRTADTRHRHEQSVPSPMKAPAPPPQQQQPAVLLTAIRIPQPNQPPQLVPTSPQQQVTVANVNVAKAQQNGASAAASKIPTGPSLYQIPMMPNLVQFPNLIAANVSQLTAARGNHHHHPTTTAQYFLNGTVFKLQQFTAPQTGANPPSFSIENGNQSINTATVTTTATSIEQHPSNTKNTSSITATSLQEMLSNQFQTQQQQQQSVAAHNHRLHHSQPVFMTTTTGLLLNAASLPTMLGSGKQAMALQSQQIPALQPIQGASAMMPGLSSIFSPHQELTAQQLQQYKSEQVALDTESPLQPTHLPPLSVSTSAFSKLAIVKAGGAFTPSVHQVSATQPPPLVTISSGSQNVIVSSKASGNKPSAKPYQKKTGQQESVAKSKKNTSDGAKKALLEPASPVLPFVPPPLSKSPPALSYPSLIAHKEDQKRTEDLFDLLKNSKNETTLTPPSTLYQSAEMVKEEPLNAICVQASSPLLSLETTSSTTISDESIKLEESLSSSLNTSASLECSLASTSLISIESPKLIIDPKREEVETTANVSEASSTDSIAATLSPTVDTALADSDTLPKSAISPILSQPKTIRFPAKHESGHRFGPKGMRRHDGVCYWDKCNKKHESSSKLLDHMQTHHVNTQTGPFACLWLGCKVYGRESCSRRWLERHVLSHGGTKPFKCIVDGCGLRFGSQLALQKHVNGHFTATESKDSTSKRASDPPVPKLLRKNGKKLRYRRQPFSARMFDFFDAGIMEGLQHRLRQISTLTNGKNSITFQGEIIMRRKNLKGTAECYVQWAPPKIISNEWLPESGKPYIKTLLINRMQPNEKTNVESLLKSAYRLPHSPNLFQSFHSLSRQNSQDSTTNYLDHSQSIATTEDTTDETSRSSSLGNPSVGSISNLPLKLPQMKLRQKQSRKPPKRIQPS